jgi:DNA-binding GntR family transcriptional regulator
MRHHVPVDSSTAVLQGRGTARERVAASLRADILDGRLAPGTPLRTEAVMARFGVSNSPLREAFAQLAAEGLVEVNRNRGAMVAPLTREGAIDLLDVNALLWEGAVRRALPRLTPPEIETLRRIDGDFQIAVRSGDLAGAILDSERFQAALLGACGSAELVRTIETGRPRVLRIVRMLATLPVIDVLSVVHTETLAAAGTSAVERPLTAFGLLWGTLTDSLAVNAGIAPSLTRLTARQPGS